MQRSGGAAILMQQGFNGVKVLFARADCLETMINLPAKRVFDEDVCNFLNHLSAEIRRDTEAKRHADLMAFGFFCRKSNIERMRQVYAGAGRIGRGVSFHIAPSNVPVMSAYTLAAGLLSGNACIVRVSSKDFEQTEILCRLLRKTAADAAVGDYIAVVQYDRNREINDKLSSCADVRVIWGGDHTVNEIRRSPIPPRCVEAVFADRYSVCVLDAGSVERITDWQSVVNDFYNDTYLYDQNACTSPRLMYWLGTGQEVQNARKLFWRAVYEGIKERYEVRPIVAVDKLMTDFRAAVELDGIKTEKDEGNLFHRIWVKKLTREITGFACPGGSFIEYGSSSLDDLAEIVTNKYQTLSYFGCSADEIAGWVLEKGLRGIDRIVPMGKTADFSLTWDGYDLIETMSRKVYF